MDAYTEGLQYGIRHLQSVYIKAAAKWLIRVEVAVVREGYVLCFDRHFYYLQVVYVSFLFSAVLSISSAVLSFSSFLANMYW